MAYLKNRQRVDIALGEVVYDDVDEEDERYQKWKSKALNVLGELVLPDNDPVVAPSDALGARSPNKFIDPDASSPAVSAKKAKRDKKNKKRRVEDGLELNSEGYPRLSNHWHKTLSADLCIATVMIVVALVLVILPLDGGDTLFARVANASTNSSDVLDLSNTLHRPNFWLFVTLHHPLFFLFAVLYMYEYLKHSCNVFTAKWQIVSAMVGVAQLLVMNIVAYFATNRFRTTTRVEASVILIFTTASSAFAPFACPLVLMILKKRAINKLQHEKHTNAVNPLGENSAAKPVANKPTVSMATNMMVFKAASKFTARARRAKDVVNLKAWLCIFIAMCLNIVTWCLLQIFTYYFVHGAKSAKAKGIYIFWFNIMMTVLKMVTKIILQQGDIIRIGVVEAEWHRYLLANRCEYAFALYGSVFKFTLFTEIENWSDFGAFVGVDMLMDTVKSSFMMTRWFVKMDAKFKGTIGMLTGETDGSTVDTRSPRDTPKRNTGSIHGVDVNQSEDTGSQKVRKAKLLFERDQHAAIVRQRSRICYQLHCKVLGTSTGALQLVLIGLVIRHGWNSELFPHFSRMSGEQMETTIFFVTLRWLMGIAYYICFSVISNKTVKVSPLSTSILIHATHPDMRRSYAMFVGHICTDVYFALLIQEFGKGAELF